MLALNKWIHKFVACMIFVMTATSIQSYGSELVSKNPFDPQRKPWTVPAPPPTPLPILTAQDLQIEGIVIFGGFRGVIAQLDGKLKGTLPANSAGKVRIGIGQSFGAGYLLERVESNYAVILAGTDRFTIPLVRKTSRSTLPQANSPLPAQTPMSPFNAGGVPAAQSAPETVPPQMAAPDATNAAGGSNKPIGIDAITGSSSAAASTPQGTPAPGQNQQGQGTAPATQPPKTLLEAIMAAREASKNQAGTTGSATLPSFPGGAK